MREMAEICEQIEQQHDPGNMPLQCLAEIELEDDL
jgi:hypothetical protein